MKVNRLLNLGKTAVTAWIDDYASSMGAAIAYYTVFSLAPLLIIAIAVAAIFFGEQTARQELLEQLRALLGDQGANAVEMMLTNAQKPKQGTIASVLSVATLVIGATGVFNELESDLNRIWKVQGPEVRGIWHLLRARLLSFGMVLAIGFLLLVSLIISAGLSAWGKYWDDMFLGVETLLQAANFVVSLLVITVLFALMYKILPSVKIAWRHVWLGAVVTALLFSLGKFVIGLYIGKSSVASSYGAAGALVVLLLWVYFSAQIFLFGAELTKAVANGTGPGASGRRAPRDPASPPF
jgi:membrane protein